MSDVVPEHKLTEEEKSAICMQLINFVEDEFSKRKIEMRPVSILETVMATAMAVVGYVVSEDGEDRFIQGLVDYMKEMFERRKPHKY